jgi:hypothetical protein
MTSTTQAATRKLPDGALKAFIASLTGPPLEYYKVAIYGVAPALLFHKICCPADGKVDEVYP